MSQNINTVDISNDANLEDYVLVSVNGSLRRVKVANLKELVDSTEDIVVVDTELSTTSVNPVQNRVITEELNKKANSSDMPTYQKKIDNTLTTTSKEVVGAINENTSSINQLSGGKADKIEVSKLKEDLSEFKRRLKTRVESQISDVKWVRGTIDQTTGNDKDSMWDLRSSIFAVVNNEDYTFDFTGDEDVRISWYCYDNDENFLGRLVINLSQMPYTRKFDYPQGTKKIRLLIICNSSNPVSLEAYKYLSLTKTYRDYTDDVMAGVKENKVRINENERLIDEITGKTMSDNPLSTILKTTGMLDIFHTVGCIGDSLMAGQSCSNETGAVVYHNTTDYSWPACLAKATNNVYYNWAVGGVTSKNWQTHPQAIECFDGNHLCTAYIIGLGQNDSNQNVSVGSVNDINLTDYTQNNDTFYGNYGKIIQKIKEIQPKAKIFVITDPKPKTEEGGYNQAVRSMETIFSDVYCLDLFTYASDIYFGQGSLINEIRRNGHFNAFGYKLMAEIIATYIDWYVRKYYQEFQQVEFIGTNFSWS